MQSDRTTRSLVLGPLKISEGGPDLDRGLAVLKDPEGELDRIGGCGLGPRRIVGLDLEKLDADESVIAPMGPTGEAVALGPLAGEGGIGPAEVRAELGIV